MVYFTERRAFAQHLLPSPTPARRAPAPNTSPTRLYLIARAMVMDEVPRPFDRIQVLYELEKGEQTWWPAVVLDSCEQRTPGRMKGSAVVEYAAMHGMKATTMTLYFFANRCITSDDGDSIWRTSAEAADEGDGDDNERDWEGSAARLEGASKRRLSLKRRAPSAVAVNTDVNTDTDSAGSECIPIEPSVPTRTVLKSTRKGKVDLVVEGLSSKDMRVRKTGKRGERPWEDDVADVKRQLTALERRVDARADERLEALTSRIVNANKNVWKTRFLEKIDKVNEHEPRSERVFSEALQLGSIRITDMTDFETFQDIVENMGKRTDSYQPRGIHFVPSLLEITNPNHDIYEVHVLFDRLSTFLRWLGFTCEADLTRHLVKNSKGRKGADLTRVMGGTQCKEDATNYPVRVFVGASCVPPHLATADLSGDGISSPTVHFPNSIWDEANNVFATQPVWFHENAGRISGLGESLTNSSGSLKKSVFSVSWVWRRTTGGRGYSSHGRRTGLMRLGDVTINLPYAVFHGSTTCEDVRHLLQKNSVAECI